MKLVLGTAQFGLKYGLNQSKVNIKEIKMIDKILQKKSISYIDTATSYGNSEKIISKIRTRKNVITKIKLPQKTPKDIEKWFNDTLKMSLNNLKIKKLYGLLIHDTKDLFNQKELINCLMNAKKKKYVKKIGISVYDPDEIVKIIKIWTPDIIQLPVNILDQRFLKNNLLSKLKKLKIEIFARSCFLQGLLLKKRIRSIKHVNQKKFILWCKKEKISQLKACIDFIKNVKKIDFLVIGVDSNKQLKQIIDAFYSETKKISNQFECLNKNIIDPRRW